jgi:hypothetical protein
MRDEPKTLVDAFRLRGEMIAKLAKKAADASRNVERLRLENHELRLKLQRRAGAR